MSPRDPLTTRAWALLALAAENRADDVEPLLDDLSRDDVATLAYGVAHLAVHTLALVGHPLTSDTLRAVLLAAARHAPEGGTL